jgi:hypothetical protein
MARVGPKKKKKKKTRTVFSWLVKRPVEMVGVRTVKAKWPVCIELVRLPNATKNVKETRITISGTDFNMVHRCSG